MAQDVYSIITDRIVAALEQGVVPWRRPWRMPTHGDDTVFAANLFSKRPYRGVNVFVCVATSAAAGYDQPYWCTFNQARAHELSVRKGERGTPIVFWNWIRRRDKQTGDEVSIPFVRYFTVFNVAQLDGDWQRFVPAKPEPATEEEQPAWDAIAEAEAVVARYLGDNGPALHVSESSRACYSPMTDRVQVPDRQQFELSGEFYSTLFHELGHSTGHATRLKRPGITNPAMFGSHAYSQEELVAEMTAAFLCGVTGIECAQVEENQAAYLACWITKLRAEPKLCIQAGAQAQKAADLIRGINPAAEREANDEAQAA